MNKIEGRMFDEQVIDAKFFPETKWENRDLDPEPEPEPEPQPTPNGNSSGAPPEQTGQPQQIQPGAQQPPPAPIQGGMPPNQPQHPGMPGMPPQQMGMPGMPPQPVMPGMPPQPHY